MKGVIPAAGLGTRFLPVTKAQPKEMLPVYDKPVIQYVIEEAVQSGIEDILIITGRGKRAIEDHFDRAYELEDMLRERGKEEDLREILSIADLAKIHYIRQKSPKGLGDSVLQAECHVGHEPFAVLLGDIITQPNHETCLDSLRMVHDKYGASVIAVERVADERISSFGIIKGEQIEDGLYLIEDLVEKPSIEEAPSNLAIFGRYILTPAIFSCLKATQPGSGGEVQLTDAMKLLLETEKIYAYEIDQLRFDIGNKVDWVKATIHMALQQGEAREPLIEYMREHCPGEEKA